MSKRRVIQRYYDELFNQGKLELLNELLDPDYVNHSPGSPQQARGRAGVAAVIMALRRAFPDLRYRIEDIVESADAVAVRTTMSGTHRGDFFGLAATGRAFAVPQIAIEHFRGARIIAHHRVTNEALLMQQLTRAGDPT